MRSVPILPTLLALLSLYALPSAVADCPKFNGVAPDGFYGYAVAIDGDNAIAGEIFGNGGNGAAAPFEWSGGGWQALPVLIASDADSDDRFGQSVAISGDVAVISAHYNDDDGVNSGSVYVFRKSGGVWAEEQKLTAYDAAPNDEYGRSIAVDGDLIVVGSWFDTDSDFGIRSGSAYVYRYDGENWVLDDKLTPSNPSANDRFANEVSIDGNVIVVGSYQEDGLGTDSGAAYVFRYNGATWVEEQILRSTVSTRNYFGRSVAVSGDVIASSQIDLSNTAAHGYVYIFRWDGVTWNEEITISGSIDHYGVSVDADGDRVLIGARLADSLSEDGGLAYLWEWDGSDWSRTRGPLSSFDISAGDEFGNSVAVDGDRILIGAPLAGDSNEGAAYFYDLQGPAQVINVSPGESIQAAIDQMCYRGEVIVEPGTYNESISLKGKAITVRSVDPADPDIVASTVIDAAGLPGLTSAVKCNANEGWDAVLSGLTITGGSGEAFDDATLLYGGGMYIVASNPTVTNCTFVNNSLISPVFPGTGGLDKVSYGGGMYISSGRGPRISHCRFIDNTAYISDVGFVFGSGDARGGGVFVAGRADIVNCLFNGNAAGSPYDVTLAGGGAYVGSGSSTFTNCTFANNRAGTGASGYFISNTVTNCIIAGDDSDHLVAPGSTVEYSIVTGGWPGTGNLDSEPGFVDIDGPDDVPGNHDDDLRLMPCSSAIDMGTRCPSALDGIEADLDGNPRISNGLGTSSLCFGTPDDDPCAAGALIDIGAYEALMQVRSADLDGDGDVDLEDYFHFIKQFTGSQP